MTGSAEARRLIRSLVEKIVREYRPEKVILFGSYAHDTPDEDSDIDLFIIKETTERPIDREIAVVTIVSDAHRLTPFDPHVMTPGEVRERLRMGDQFIREIIETGEVLYESPGIAASR